MRKIWKQKTPLCQAQICISTLVSSLLWHFLHQFFAIHFLFLKIISKQIPEKMANAWTLQQNTSLTLSCLRILCRYHTKRNTEADALAGRLTHVPPKTPELGVSQTGKQRNGKTCREIFIIIVYFLYFVSCLKYLCLYLLFIFLFKVFTIVLIFVFLFSYAENVTVQNTPELHG